MYKEIAFLLNEYNKRKAYVDEDYVKEVCDIIREYYKLEGYVVDCRFDDSEDWAGYTPLKKKITVNLCNNRDNVFTDNYPYYHYIFFNAIVTLNLFHEFTHANQYKFIKEYDEDKDRILYDLIVHCAPQMLDSKLVSVFKSIIQYNYYTKNWRNDPTERMALITSYYEIMETLKEIYSYEGIEPCYNFMNATKDHYLCNYALIEDYTNSPTINYLSSLPLEKKYLEEQENRDRLLDPSIPYNIRLLYGLPLKESEYRNLIIMANHNKRELEKSINRYTKHYVLLPSFNIKRVK